VELLDCAEAGTATTHAQSTAMKAVDSALSFSVRRCSLRVPRIVESSPFSHLGRWLYQAPERDGSLALHFIDKKLSAKCKASRKDIRIEVVGYGFSPRANKNSKRH
jgi:hypothetical protein